MNRCWAQSPDKRPSFQDLVGDITSMLDNVAGYLDLSSHTDEGRMRYDHLANKGYDKLASALRKAEQGMIT